MMMKNRIREILSNILEIPLENIQENSDFVTDLGMDSMAALEFIAAIEKEFKVVVPEDLFFELTDISKTENTLRNLKR